MGFFTPCPPSSPGFVDLSASPETWYTQTIPIGGHDNGTIDISGSVLITSGATYGVVFLDVLHPGFVLQADISLNINSFDSNSSNNVDEDFYYFFWGLNAFFPIATPIPYNFNNATGGVAIDVLVQLVGYIP
jgi:hypothetical protein